MGKQKHIIGWMGLAYLDGKYIGGHAGSREDVMTWATNHFGKYATTGSYRILIESGIMPEYRKEYL